MKPVSTCLFIYELIYSISMSWGPPKDERRPEIRRKNHFVCPPAECVCFSNNKKQPRLPPALISMNQLRIRARHPSTPQQSHPSPPTVPLIQHRAKDAYQLSAAPGALLKPCCALVLPSCNSISIFKFLSPQNEVPHEQAHCASLSLICRNKHAKLKKKKKGMLWWD